MKFLFAASVLIIDNDDGVSSALKIRLQNRGYHCFVAQNGLQGISQFTESPTDLIVTDLNMPILDGVGVIEKIRRMAQIPIIVITGFYQKFQSELYDKPNIRIVGKPFNVHDLMDIIDTQLDLNKHCCDHLARLQSP